MSWETINCPKISKVNRQSHRKKKKKKVKIIFKLFQYWLKKNLNNIVIMNKKYFNLFLIVI